MRWWRYNMKKTLLAGLIYFFPLVLFSQDYQLNVTAEFDLKLPGLKYLAYDNEELCVYDSVLKRIILFDQGGNFIDSTIVDYKVNGLDLYQDTLFILKTDKQQTTKILRANKKSAKVYDSLIWFIGDEKDYSEFITVNDHSYLCYISVGWLNNLVHIDSSGLITGSVFAPNLGLPSGISHLSGNKYCYISSMGEGENANFYEYEVHENGIVNTYVTGLPVKAPKGITSIDENSFFVYSGLKRKMYRIDKTRLKSYELTDYENSGKVSLYPNPAKEMVNIKADLAIDRVNFLNIDGKLVNSVDNPKNPISVDKYTKGFYILELYINGRKLYKGLVIN